MAKSIYTEEERKQRKREAKKAYDKRWPERKKARRDRQKAAKMGVVNIEAGKRVCCLCGLDKPVEHFKKHSRGYSYKCLDCSPVLTREERNARRAEKGRNVRAEEAKKRSKEDKPPRLPKPKPEKVAKPRADRAPKAKSEQRRFEALKEKPDNYSKINHVATMISLGWTKVGGVSDINEQVMVYIKFPLIAYVRYTMGGKFRAGKVSYGIAGDDSGTRYYRLNKAEAAVKKIYKAG